MVMADRWQEESEDWNDESELESEALAEPSRLKPAGVRAAVPLFIMFAGLVSLLYSMQLGSVTTSGYDLQRLDAERREWRQRNEQLELELAKSQSLAWIEVEAVRRLGMQRAERVTYLEVAPSVPPAADDQQGVAPTMEPAAITVTAGNGVMADVLSLWRGLLELVVPPLDAAP
jgi:hypothetical protein